MNLAQLNIALAKELSDHQVMKEFTDNLAPINQLAEASEGFIWRLTDSADSEAPSDTTNNTTNNTTNDDIKNLTIDDPKLLVNMSVWESPDALKQFMFKTHHLGFMQRKQEWFTKLPAANHVLWWIPEGHLPDLTEGWHRLNHLREKGESPFGFTFKSKFTPADLHT